VQLIGYVTCDPKKTQIAISSDCNIVKLEIFFPCPACSKYLNVIPLNLDDLSFDYIAILEKTQKYVVFPGELIPSSSSDFQLAGLITYFA